MRIALLAFALILVLTLAGCFPIVGNSGQLTGSGKLVTQDFSLSGFDSLEVGSNFNVTLHQGDTFAVSVTADDNVMPHLAASVSGKVLRLGLKPGQAFGMTRVTMKAEVTMPSLKQAKNTENGILHLGSLKGDDLTLGALSNGIFDGNVAVLSLALDANSNGQVKLSGSTDKLKVTGGGNAIFTLGGLTAKTVRVDLNSNGMATVKATEKLDYSVIGNAHLIYSGGAALGEQKTGGNATARAQ